MSRIYSCQFKTRVGILCLSATRNGLYALDWSDTPLTLTLSPQGRGARMNHFSSPPEGERVGVRGDIPKPIDSFLKKAIREIQRYLQGRKFNFNRFPIDWSGVPPFEKKVLQILRKLPRGRTATYQSLAAKAGRPKAARYVGRIMNRNRLPLVIPCHRIVAKAGGLGGFSRGVRLKRRLLKLERAAVDKKPGS